MVTERDREVVGWIGRLGAAAAADVMGRFGMGRTATYRRLAALVDDGLLATERLLYGQPTLYVATRDGLQWARLARLDPCRVGVTSARHFALCAQLAVVLERTESGYRVWSEREVRVAKASTPAVPVASAELGRLPDGRPRLRRADFVLVRVTRPAAGRGSRSRARREIGAPRFEDDLRAWARCRLVDHVRYYASPAAARAVTRAVARVQAHDVVGSVVAPRPWREQLMSQESARAVA